MSGAKGQLMLDVLMMRRREWVTQCVFCGCDVVNVRLMPPCFKPRLLTNGRQVQFHIDGHRHTANVVTADHYFERRDGGRSYLNNILPACAICNRARSTEYSEMWCVDCQTEKRSIGKRCDKCGSERLKRHLARQLPVQKSDCGAVNLTAT